MWCFSPGWKFTPWKHEERVEKNTKQMRKLFSASFNHLVNFSNRNQKRVWLITVLCQFYKKFYMFTQRFLKSSLWIFRKGSFYHIKIIPSFFLWKTSSSEVFTSKFIGEKFSLYEASIKTFFLIYLQASWSWLLIIIMILGRSF